MEKFNQDLFSDKSVETNELTQGGGTTWTPGTCRNANGGPAITDEVSDEQTV